MRMRNAARRAAALVLVAALLALVTGCTDKSAAYDKALAVFGTGDYAAAAEAFTKIGNYLEAETYAAYAQGLTYWEQGGYTEAEPFFEKTRNFMYGEQRYLYCHAAVLEAAGQFADAALGYDGVGAFENAPLRAAYCRGRAAVEREDYEAALIGYKDAGDYADAAARLDALNFEIYSRATEFKDAQAYEKAFQLFTLLGDQYDAPELARVCKNFLLDQTYADAEAKIAANDLQGAYEAFSMLAGYRDAQTRATELAAQLGIDLTQGD